MIGDSIASLVAVGHLEVVWAIGGCYDKVRYSHFAILNNP